MTQGTVNGGDRGNVHDRRRRREWLVKTFAADWPLVRVTWTDGSTTQPEASVLTPEKLLEFEYVAAVEVIPTCRCYRCGRLLTVDTVSPDRIIPGCLGGTYRRNNIRPACLPCQSVTGNEIKRAVRGSR